MPSLPRSPLAPTTALTLGLVALAALAVGACTDDTTNADGGSGSCDLLAGDLVITETVADVEGQDKGLEWFEIYNASSNPVDLQGRTLVYSKADGSGRKTHTVARELILAPGQYITVGAVLDDLVGADPNLDYGYGDDLGEFGNAGGYLAIECGDDVVDEAYYADAVPTASRAFDGSQVPDAAANDFVASWCDSRTELTPGFAATPRAANDVCGSQEGCLLDGETVAVARPQPGDLVITEIMADPDLVGDADGEWFEIHSLASGDLHLNGLELGKSLDDPAEETIAAAECIVITPGSYVVVAGNPDAMVNGGIPAEAIVWDMSMSLTNSGGSVWIGVDGELLDAYAWTSVRAGEATQLDPDFSDPTANDEPSNWCDAVSPYGDGQLGTPGAVNDQCLIAPPDGQCYDGGRLRAIQPPAQGDLVITELLPNPEAVDDAAGEWFEVLARGSGDLNGLEIGKAGSVADTLIFEDCVSVAAGDYLVFAREADPLVNGGLSEVDATFDMAINNTGSDLFIGYAGVVWDQVTWTSSTAGASRSFGAQSPTADGNDGDVGWCDGVGVYGDGDQGTPGIANPMCGGGPVDGMCLDLDTNMMRMVDPPTAGELTLSEIMPNPSLTEPGAEWFELHASASFDLNGVELGKGGAVSHTISSATCLEVAADDYVVLARSDVDAENCALPAVDYTYAGLSLTNSNSDLEVGYGGVVLDSHAWTTTANGTALSYDPNADSWCAAVDSFGCGDLATPGMANPACGGGGNMDGMCFDGQDWRAIVPPQLGDLVISEFMANPDVVADADGEWFEVRALAACDLNGVTLGQAFVDGALDTVDASDCIALAVGDTALLARDGDPMINGGLPPVDFVFGFGLTNSNSALHLAVDGVLLDEIAWTGTTAGKSTSLDPGSYDPSLNDTANNADPNWCYSATPYSMDNDGTPGADNEQCP